MIEIVTVDGKQFELTTEYPLTEQQRQQTISDIRRQTGCTSCNKTQSLGGGIQTLATACVDVNVLSAADIVITDITIVGTCTIGGACAAITCETVCTDVLQDVVVTFKNNGDIVGAITPVLSQTVNAIPVASPVITTPPIVPVSVGAGETVLVTFGGVKLLRGTNNVCITY